MHNPVASVTNRMTTNLTSKHIWEASSKYAHYRKRLRTDTRETGRDKCRGFQL